MNTENTYSFSDVFKSKFLESFSLSNQNMTLPNIILGLLAAFLLGLFIYFIYKKTFRGVLYSHSFNLSLIMLTMVTTLVIMCISSAPALSLGMVGALSIVRFRTAVKDPVDTVYMFWAIVAGITIGANFVLYAFVGCLIIGGILIALSIVGNKISNNYLLVVRYDEYAARDIARMLHNVQKVRLKSKTVTANGVEATYELRLSDKQMNICEALMQVNGVGDATLVAFQNEIG
ncbi:MAG: DUF4956 domain-containing protein [Clostridia bacterium]|nr:DUF4956 domain-containing protein [Clostridia bacterium]